MAKPTETLRPELFDEPLARSDEERIQSYGQDWIDELAAALKERQAAALKRPKTDQPEETEGEPTEDKFLPRRK